MGNCFNKPDPNTKINKYLDKAEHEDFVAIKVVLLGTGASGKSTLFKSLQISHEGHLGQSERDMARKMIRSNIIEGIDTLLSQSEALYQLDATKYAKCQLITNEEIENAKNVITKYQSTSPLETMGASDDMDPETLEKMASAVKLLWALAPLKETARNHGKYFAFSDNLEYFFEKVDEVMNEKYVPNDLDCLKNRTKTSGMNEYVFKADASGKIKCKVVDVGGQRAERRKWIQYFDNVHALIFVASLIDYNKVLYEDSSANGMTESLTLFSEMTKLEHFANCDIILMLNKDDLLQHLLHKTPNNGLSDCFSAAAKWPRAQEFWNSSKDSEYVENFNKLTEESGGATDTSQHIELFDSFHRFVIEFILNLYLARNQSPMKREVYHHITIATEPGNNTIGSMFSDIANIVVRHNLEQSGALTK